MARKGQRHRDGRDTGGDLPALIRRRYPDLPANQKRVADYLLHHLQEVAFLSILDLERRSGVSKATVVRFAQSLGFSGFAGLRDRILEGVQLQIRIPERFALNAAGDQADTLAAVARQDVENINQTINHLERATFGDVAARILGASRVYTAGLGISSLMAQILAYSLNQVAVRASALVHGYETFLEQAAFLTPEDLLIVFSFPPYSRETIDLVRVASGRKIPVVALTDRMTSPVSFHAAAVIPIRSRNMLFTNSFSAISVVMNAIATEVALRNRDRALSMTSENERLLRETGHYDEA